MTAHDGRSSGSQTMIDRPGTASGSARLRTRQAVARRALGGERLFTNAAALVVNTGATSVLGFGFWVIAARHHTPAAVGAASALISVLLILSGVAQVDLDNVLARFMPVLREHAGRLLLGGYALSAVLSIVVSIAVLVPLQARVDWFPAGHLAIPWLAATVVAVSIFDLQDGALIGLRRAVWIPIENITIGVARVALVALLGLMMIPNGILVAWTLPMAACVVPVNLLLMRRLLSQHAAAPAAAPAPAAPRASIDVRAITRFAGGDYLGDMLAMGVRHCMPLIITALLGVESNGYFYVAWLIGLTFDGALHAVGSSLTAEGAHDPHRLAQLVRGLALRIAAVGLPVIMLIAAAAPLLLTIVGGAYAQQATGLLRLLALAFIPRAVIVLWVSLARVEQRVSRILAMQGCLALCVLGLSSLLITRLGIAGAGWAYLVSQSIVAAFLLPKMWWLLRRGSRDAAC